jgi:Protein of unknown function (DUF1573)
MIISTFKKLIVLVVFGVIGCYPVKPNPYLHDTANILPNLDGIYVKNPFFLVYDLTKGTQKTFDFTLKNRTKKDLILESVKSSCKCTTLKYDNQSIKPGETRHILATFHGDYSGPFHHTVYIKTNYSANYLGLILEGTVKE